MGRPLKKGERGAATAYYSRKQALKKLQLSLKDFRRLCILKGIYPAEPGNKKKVNKNNSTNKTHYYVKDIQFLLHEPVIEKFREFRIFIRKLKKAIGKKDQEHSHRLQNNTPTYRLDHIVKERYPSFVDALRDVDDALSMCFLFATIPKNRAVKVELIQLCRKITMEFMHYVIQTRCLRKVFISIKGFYYQIEVMGQEITWVVPHALGYNQPNEVDFKIMVTFTEFYSTMLGFLNYKLYNTINLIYPPKLSTKLTQAELLSGEDEEDHYVATLNQDLKKSLEANIEDEVKVDEFAELEDGINKSTMSKEEMEKFTKLFEGCKFYLNREVPVESLIFVIRSFGGEVSFDKTVLVGATFDEDDQSITHHIIDRPAPTNQYLNRYYVQPQWVFDCVNAQELLPVQRYFPGETLPPHLSPFVEEKEGDYIPPEKLSVLEKRGQVISDKQTTPNVQKALKRKPERDSDDEDDEDVVKSKKPVVLAGTYTREDDLDVRKKKEAAEEKRLALLMMPKKRKHLYNKIIFGQKRRRREAEKLREKREDYEKKKKLKA